MITEIVYTWPDGRKEVRYRRIKDSQSALEMMEQVDEWTRKLGDDSPYKYQHVEAA